MSEGILVVVSGRSQKGKNRISEHGNVWKIKTIQGPKILLESIDGKSNLRWVDGPEDRDFQIVKTWENN